MPKASIPCYTCGPPNDGNTESAFYQCNLLLQETSMSDDESSTGSVPQENVEVEETTDLSNS
jgi:hypothetical protein